MSLRASAVPSVAWCLSFASSHFLYAQQCAHMSSERASLAEWSGAQEERRWLTGSTRRWNSTPGILFTSEIASLRFSACVKPTACSADHATVNVGLPLRRRRRRRVVVSSLQKFNSPSCKIRQISFLKSANISFCFSPERWSRPTMATAPWGEMDLNVNRSNCLSRNESDCGLSASSSGVSTALASVLIFTIVVDILGNILVILSVYRNKKLRNAGERSRK